MCHGSAPRSCTQSNPIPHDSWLLLESFCSWVCIRCPHVLASVLSVQGSFSPPSDQALLPRITNTRPPTCPLCRASLLWAVAQLPATSAHFAENISTKKELPGAVGGHARPRANLGAVWCLAGSALGGVRDTSVCRGGWRTGCGLQAQGANPQASHSPALSGSAHYNCAGRRQSNQGSLLPPGSSSGLSGAVREVYVRSARPTFHTPLGQMWWTSLPTASSADRADQFFFPSWTVFT